MFEKLQYIAHLIAPFLRRKSLNMRNRMSKTYPPGTANFMKNAGNPLSKYYGYALVIVLICFVLIILRPAFLFGAPSTILSTGGSSVITLTSSGHQKLIKAATWNIAAINNNPFEYWITTSNPQYSQLMQNVSTFITNPKEMDIAVSEVFTPVMFTQLKDKLQSVGITTGLIEMTEYWESNFKSRKIISQFIKDGNIGKKRLASMPDRVTNTIIQANSQVATRPTVINCYINDKLDSMESWWKQWTEFMFIKPVSIKQSNGTVKDVKVYQLIPKLERSKYPAVTEAEEDMSIPLQILSLAIFDAILIFSMNDPITAHSPSTWQSIRKTMCQQLNFKKNDRIAQIIEQTYADSDIIFLQEVAGSYSQFIKKRALSSLFDIHASKLMDPDRDQNSFILLKKGQYRDVIEVTEEANKFLYSPPSSNSTKKASKVPVVKGDLIVLTAVDSRDGVSYLLASFHGDTNGLATKPVLEAVYLYAVAHHPNSRMLFGMDANTYTKPDEDQYGVVDFAQFYTNRGLNTCYGPTPSVYNFTTFHARTHLQPQLNKAVTYEEKDRKGDKNLKDFIVFFKEDFRVLSTKKDNTGDKIYIENMVFPTLSFPSDHGVTSTVLEEAVKRGQPIVSKVSSSSSSSKTTAHLKTRQK